MKPISSNGQTRLFDTERAKLAFGFVAQVDFQQAAEYD